MRDIYYEYQKEQDEMLSRYVKKYFSIDKYYAIMLKLKELKAYGDSRACYYGDADVYAHIEKIKDVDCLVINNVVSCYDRPVCVIQVVDLGTSFRPEKHRHSIKAICTTMKSVTRYENMFNDRRDYKQVGLDIIAKKGFKYLYGDSRDKEWAFNTPYFKSGYENLTRDNTLFVLSQMDTLYEMINDLRRD